MTKENKLSVLDELSKGCSMGTDSINYVLDKVKNKKSSNYRTKNSQTTER